MKTGNLRADRLDGVDFNVFFILHQTDPVFVGCFGFRRMPQAQQGMAGAAPGEPGEDIGSQPVPGGQMQAPAGPAPQPGGPGDPIAMMVDRLRSVSPQAQEHVLQRIAQQNPQLAQQVLSQLRGTGGTSGGASAPLPTQLPPRRGPETAMI